MQFFEDLVGGGRPPEGLAIGIVLGDKVVDTLQELLDAGEKTAADGLVNDRREEGFYLIEPGTVGRDEMYVLVRARCRPRLDLRMGMGGVLVRDAVDVQFVGWHSLVDLAQEGMELLVPMRWPAGHQYGAVEHIQCSNRVGAP